MKPLLASTLVCLSLISTEAYAQGAFVPFARLETLCTETLKDCEAYALERGFTNGSIEMSVDSFCCFEFVSILPEPDGSFNRLIYVHEGTFPSEIKFITTNEAYLIRTELILRESGYETGSTSVGLSPDFGVTFQYRSQDYLVSRRRFQEQGRDFCEITVTPSEPLQDLLYPTPSILPIALILLN